MTHQRFERLIFEDRAVQTPSARILWSLLTLALWLGFLAVLVPPARDLIACTIEAVASLASRRTPWDGVARLDPGHGEHAMHLAMGMMSLLLSGFTLPRALSPRAEAAQAEAIHAEAPQADAGRQRAPMSEAVPGFLPDHLTAIRQARRMVVHHDATGHVRAITLLADEDAGIDAGIDVGTGEAAGSERAGLADETSATQGPTEAEGEADVLGTSAYVPDC